MTARFLVGRIGSFSRSEKKKRAVIDRIYNLPHRRNSLSRARAMAKIPVGYESSRLEFSFLTEGCRFETCLSLFRFQSF